MDTGGISCCFDKESRRMLEDYRKKGLDATSTAIADRLGQRGLKGSTVLEVGCGFGALSLELLRRGATSATGIDLSPKMIGLARTLAAEAGLLGSATFEVGDGADTELKKSDVVVLDAVICCYPELDALVGNSCSAAGKYYAFSVPDGDRLATKLLRPFLPLQRIFMRRGFRFFVHPTRRMRKMLETKGFREVSKTPAGWVWSVFLYAAPGVS